MPAFCVVHIKSCDSAGRLGLGFSGVLHIVLFWNLFLSTLCWIKAKEKLPQKPLVFFFLVEGEERKKEVISIGNLFFAWSFSPIIELRDQRRRYFKRVNCWLFYPSRAMWSSWQQERVRQRRDCLQKLVPFFLHSTPLFIPAEQRDLKG